MPLESDPTGDNENSHPFAGLRFLQIVWLRTTGLGNRFGIMNVTESQLVAQISQHIYNIAREAGYSIEESNKLLFTKKKAADIFTKITTDQDLVITLNDLSTAEIIKSQQTDTNQLKDHYVKREALENEFLTDSGYPFSFSIRVIEFSDTYNLLITVKSNNSQSNS